MPGEPRTLSVAPLTRGDLPAALGLQRETYPPFLVEDEAVFLNRLDLTASYCLAAKQAGQLGGYLLAHGWRRRSPPALGTLVDDGAPSEVLFIHDLAVAPGCRGQGVGERLIARAFAMAAHDGLRSAELIAVEGAAGYWRRLGFTAGALSDALSAKVRPYGTLACWMTRDIPPPRP